MKKIILIILSAGIIFGATGFIYYQASAYKAKANWQVWQNNQERGQLVSELLFFKSENLELAEQIKITEASISGLKKALAQKETVLAAPALVSNTPPGSGFSRQSVATSIGNFTVSLVAADLNSTKVIVDTASESTCANDCPVLPLAAYVARSGAFAGINGSYFCPASYPSCAGKTNSFDTLLMNKDKVYFNSDNNIYSIVPAVIFSGNSARFVSRSLEWGRDTSVDSVIANQPLLVSGNQVVFGGNDDPKQGSRGNRSFVANKGSTVFIGVVHSATVAESARVLQVLGMDNALSLDSGGSTALWSGGYRFGPGRDIPNSILFVNR